MNPKDQKESSALWFDSASPTKPQKAARKTSAGSNWTNERQPFRYMPINSHLETLMYQALLLTPNANVAKAMSKKGSASKIVRESIQYAYLCTGILKCQS